MASREVDLNKVLDAIATEIYARREQRGISRAELVDRLRETGVDISGRTLAAYEIGEREMSLKRFLQITHAVGVSPSVVFRDALLRAAWTLCPSCGEVTTRG